MRIMIPALAASMAVASSAAFAQAPAPAPLYLFLYKPGPAWEAGKPLEQQKNIGPHAAYIRGLTQSGRVVAGGPWAAGDGGMAIVRAASLDEAKTMLAADPAVSTGLFTAQIQPWQPVIDSGKPLRP